MYETISCRKFLHKIKSVPVILVNSIDDPIIPEELHEIPIQYVNGKYIECMLILYIVCHALLDDAY